MSIEERLRAVALALPGVDERETWGKPTFRVADRLFLTLGSDGSSATMKATPDDQAALIFAEPAVFSVAAYLGRHGWITVRLDRCDPDEVVDMVVDAWHQRAPRRLTGNDVPKSGQYRRAETARRSKRPGADSAASQ